MACLGSPIRKSADGSPEKMPVNMRYWSGSVSWNSSMSAAWKRFLTAAANRAPAGPSIAACVSAIRSSNVLTLLSLLRRSTSFEMNAKRFLLNVSSKRLMTSLKPHRARQRPSITSNTGCEGGEKPLLALRDDAANFSIFAQSSSGIPASKYLSAPCAQSGMFATLYWDRLSPS